MGKKKLIDMFNIHAKLWENCLYIVHGLALMILTSIEQTFLNIRNHSGFRNLTEFSDGVELRDEGHLKICGTFRALSCAPAAPLN